MLIVADGTSSVAHDKILDVEVDQDEKLITVIKDGRQKPLYIRVPDPIYTACAHKSSLRSMRRSGQVPDHFHRR